MGVFSFLEGYKTYLAAAGLFGLALYQFSQGQFEVGMQSLMAALTAFGLKDALSRQEVKVEEVKAKLARKVVNEEVK